MQKIMVKGLAKDELTLAQAGVTQGCKIMVIGSKVTDLLSVAAPSDRGTEKEELVAAPQKEKLSQQKAHRKVLDKGIPEDVAPGVKGLNEPLPPVPLKGFFIISNIFRAILGLI
ncbi:hypothetical protein QYM36_007141 [Artemia franciscana]|uniref:Ubiquitin-like domain-containing protein n=1 Tax=Artemia franciscana TaxID=6661 RepID=A0AA88L8Q2_ARTSF|nr:hypothetical protein QYM36_007141 [Artemia franciscana]